MGPNERTVEQSTSAPSPHWLDRERIQVYSIAMLIVYAVVIVIWAWMTKGFTSDHMVRPGSDFSVFWSTSYVTLKAGAIKAYDFAALQPVIAAQGSLPANSHFFLPWLYPPTFLLFVIPLSLLPYAVSYVVFIGLTGAAYVVSLVRLVGLRSGAGRAVWLAVIAFPAIYFAATIGQNSMLTAALAAFAIPRLKTQPVLAGVLIALLTIKPQLAALFPLALLAARAWKPLAVAGVAAALLLLAGIAIFGWETVPAFFANTKFAKQSMLDNGSVMWYAMPTVLSALLLAGASFATAAVAHGAVAVLAALGLFLVWRRDTSTGLRAASLAVATLMASPYLWFYEVTWVGIAIAGLTADGLRRGWLRWERELLVVAWLLPLYLGLNRVTFFPQIGPLVLALLMLAILRRVHVITRGNPDWLP